MRGCAVFYLHLIQARQVPPMFQQCEDSEPLLGEVGHGRSEDARGLGNRALLSGQWLEPTYEFRALQDGSRTLLYWQWLEGWRRSLHIVMRSRALLFGQWLELEARLQRLQLVFKSTAIQQW